MLERHQAVGALTGLAMLVDLLLEAILQPGFRRKRPHQWEALDRLPQQPRQFTHLLLAAFRRHHHPRPEDADQPDDQRCQQKDREGEFPVQPEHGAEHHKQLKKAWNRVVNGLVEHLTDAVSILGKPIGEISSRKFLKGTQFNGLKGAEQVATQALAHLQSGPCQQGVLAELGHLLHGKDQHPLADQLQNLVEIPRSQGREQLARQLNQQREAEHIDHHADRPHQQLAQMGTQQGQKSPEAGLGGGEHGGTVSML